MTLSQIILHNKLLITLSHSQYWISNSKAFLLYLNPPVCIYSDRQSKPVDYCALILKLLIFGFYIWL